MSKLGDLRDRVDELADDWGAGRITETEANARLKQFDAERKKLEMQVKRRQQRKARRAAK